MPGPVHELATQVFERLVIKKIDDSGQGHMIVPMGSTTYTGTLFKKEANVSLRPLRANPGLRQRPTVVFECGVSETSRRLTVYGQWWINDSGGAVKIVLPFFVIGNLSAFALLSELGTYFMDIREYLFITSGIFKYLCRNLAVPPGIYEAPRLSKGLAYKAQVGFTLTWPGRTKTRKHNKAKVTGPTLKQKIHITPTAVTGSPLVLKFRDIFLRKHKHSRGEKNYAIMMEDMEKYYRKVWPPVPDISSEAESYSEDDVASSSSSDGNTGLIVANRTRWSTSRISGGQEIFKIINKNAYSRLREKDQPMQSSGERGKYNRLTSSTLIFRTGHPTHICAWTDKCSNHGSRIRGSQRDILGGSRFVWGDEALFVGGKGIEFTSDEIEILAEEFSRNSPFANKSPLKPLRLLGEVVHKDRLGPASPTPEEHVMRSSDKMRLDNPHPGTLMRSEKAEHFGKQVQQDLQEVIHVSRQSISATEVLAHRPGFSSLDSGFDFHKAPLRLSNLDSSNVSLEISPILIIDRSSRSSGDQLPRNTANPTPSPHVVDVVLKDGKGRARRKLEGKVLEETCEKPHMSLSPSVTHSVRRKALERNIARLKDGVELLSKLEQKHQRVLLEGELRALHYKEGHANIDLKVQDLKNYIPVLEEKICKSRKEGRAGAKEAQGKVPTVACLRKALEMKGLRNVITRLQDRLKNTEESHCN
ncbi:hypothetical protein HOY82DRAFT_607064 [Tuber indicum]|nr:hypothetical protein HOY82DRAFT_607064 [Tuber indicum]